jgi:ABC-2 type transport system ATP-binding protein
MTERAVKVRGLRKRYGEVTAVDDPDVGIRQGEVFGVLGPSGAGKSTTVEILQGHRTRDAGEVGALGADPATGTATGAPESASSGRTNPRPPS